MNRTLSLIVVVCLLSASISSTSTARAADKPIRALLVTGGCCHDYSRQKLIITKGISARADVVWTVVQQGGTTTNTKIPLYEDPNWADGFDIIVHNECFSNVPDQEWLDGILKPHKAGTPAILIHCAMHCYRTGKNDWFEFCGMQSPGHGPHYSYTVENVKPEHPIMQGFGKQWIAPKGELYHSIKLFPTATALGQAKRQGDKKPQTCVWTNEYGKNKTRVFATTVGHYNETMVEPTYLDMLTRGLLWAVDRKDVKLRKTNAKIDVDIRALATAAISSGTPGGTLSDSSGGKCCNEGNLAFGKTTKATSQETAKNNFAKHAVDGDLGTRWCASSGKQSGESWQVEFGKIESIKSLRIHWEKSNAAYRYKIDASEDGKAWKTVVDQSQNKKVARITPHKIDETPARFIKVSFLGASTGVWGSFWEFEAYADELPKLPKQVASKGKPTATVADVQAPSEFNVTMFGAPPIVNYPVCLTAAPTGEVFVGVDETGSLGKELGRGKVLRCVDVDGDGKADKVNVFAKMDHPRGLVYDNGSLWVLHPPFLTLYKDTDLDGVADSHETLITGISTDYVNIRGADHTTNGIRMGIDGWIYIAVGDFGFVKAVGKDGTTLSRRGGGIVRVRPDGTEMEIYCWGLRNILDVSIDPYMNIFTRDNTNDGGGWDIRTSHILQSAHYGYPSLYKNFADELMPPLADYGGGSGCGSMYFHDLRWPAPFANAFYSCDWGRSEVYRHNLPANGATFDPHQEKFLKIPRPTDMDVDGSGRMYVASWKNGKFAYGGPDVGFVAQITPRDFLPKPFPDLGMADVANLVKLFSSPSAVHRFHAQREILRRSPAAAVNSLLGLAASDAAPLYARAAAVFTLGQLDADVSAQLVKLLDDAKVAEFALRALTDRKPRLKGVPVAPIVAALASKNPRVRAQAVISLGRLKTPDAKDAVKALMPHTIRATGSKSPTATPFHKQADPGRVIPHLAVQALVSIGAADECLAAIDGPFAAGALWALRNMHSEAAVNGLIRKLSTTRDEARRREVLTALVRLYHQEGEYKEGWWGTRPDTSGPYFDRQPWSGSPLIADAIRAVVKDADKPTLTHIGAQLARHKVSIDGLGDIVKVAATRTPAMPDKPIVLPKADPNNPDQIANLPADKAAARAAKASGDATAGKQLFTKQNCIACHSFANGQTPKGPHLVDIGKRYKRPELVESVLAPSSKIAQGFDTYVFLMESGKTHIGFVVSESIDTVRIRTIEGVSRDLPKKQIELRKKQKESMMPKGLVNNLTPEQLADLLAYLESLH